MRSNLISIIIPTYDRSRLVTEAIASAAGQTYPDWELIVADDGSTDGTRQAVEAAFALTGRPEQCRYFYQQNRGVSAARNFGVRQARGKYLAFLDSDDLWRPDKLERQVAIFTNQPEAGVIYTNESWMKDQVRLNQKKRHRKYSGWIFPACLDLCLISASSILLKREVWDAVGPFDEDLPVCEDYEMWLRLTSRFPVYLIDQPLIIKRAVSPDQLSRRYPALDRFRVRALAKILNSGLPPWQKRLVLGHLIWRLNLLAKGSLKRAHLFSAWAYRQRSLAYSKMLTGAR